MTEESSGPASASPADEVLCENCARPDADLAPVHRMYVVAAAWDTEASSKTLEDVETWCYSCRTQYPHEPISPG